MAIITADQLDQEKLDRYTNGNVKLQRKILGLSAKTILISEGVLELLPDKKNGRVLKRLFESGALREMGPALTQKALDAELLGAIKGEFTEELDAKNLPDTAKLADVIAALQFDLELKVKAEMSEVNVDLAREAPELQTPKQTCLIIATGDEVDVAAGALVVAIRTTALTTNDMFNPLRFLKSEEGQRRIRELTEKKLMITIEDMLELPTTSDPGEFEARLGRLSFSPLLQQGNNEEQFVQMAVANFGRRPARSRAVVAEVLKHHGFDTGLMDSIIFLCQRNLPPARQTEAVGAVVRRLEKTSDRTNLFLAAASIVKMLEEDSSDEARQRALQVLAHKAEQIHRVIPEFFSEGRIVFLLKNLIVDAPEKFLQPAMPLLQALCLVEPNAYRAELLDELAESDNPFLIFALSQVLDDLDDLDWQDRLYLAEKEWQLYLRLIENKDDKQQGTLANNFRKRFRHRLPKSLELLGNVLSDQFSVSKRVTIIRTLDEMFAEQTAENPVSAHLSAMAAFLLDQIADDVATPEEETAIWKTQAIYASRLPEKHYAKLWQQIEQRLTGLANDDGFKTSLADMGGKLLPELISILDEKTDEKTQQRLLPVAYEKTRKSGAIEKIEVGAARLTEILPALGRLALGKIGCESMGDFHTHLNGLIAVLSHPCLSFVDFTALVAGYNKGAAEHVHLEKQRLFLIAKIAAGQQMANQAFADSCYEEFISAVKTQMPRLPKWSGDNIVIPDKMRQAMDGIGCLLNNSAVAAKIKKRMRGQLQKLLDARPEVKISERKYAKTGQNRPEEILPDPVRDWLLRLLL